MYQNTKISGITSCYYLEGYIDILTNKNEINICKLKIYLLGDIHSNENKCSTKKSLNVEDFLKNTFLMNPDKKVHLYMEFEPYDVSHKYHIKHYDSHSSHLEQKIDTDISIYKTMENFEKLKCGEYENISSKYKKNSKCIYDNLEIHYVDPRIFYLEDLFDIHDYIFEDFKNHTFDQIWSNIKKYMNVGFTKLEYNFNIFLSPSYICESVIKNIENTFPKTFEVWYNSPFIFFRQHALTIIKNYIYETWSEFINETVGNFHNLIFLHTFVEKNIIKNFEIFNDIFFNKDFISEMLLIYNNMFMDIYMIGKIFDQNNFDSSLELYNILYIGQNHVENLVKFLSKIGFDVVEKIDNGNIKSLCLDYNNNYLDF